MKKSIVLVAFSVLSMFSSMKAQNSGMFFYRNDGKIEAMACSSIDSISFMAPQIEVTASDASNVTYSSAIIKAAFDNSSISFKGLVVKMGVCYGSETSLDPRKDATIEEVLKDDVNEYTFNVFGLQSETTYNYCTYLNVNDQYFVSEVKSFVTPVESHITYKMFDFYNENGVQGIVINVDENGEHGWICSLDEASLAWTTSKDYNDSKVKAYSNDDPEANVQAMIALDPTLEAYPAAKWCMDHNTSSISGWVFPAFDQLSAYLLPIMQYNTAEKLFDGIDAFNQAIDDCPVDASKKNHIEISNPESSYYKQYAYFSSTLSDGTDNAKCIGGWPWYVQYAGYESYVCTNDKKEGPEKVNLVRAFKKF